MTTEIASFDANASTAPPFGVLPRKRLLDQIFEWRRRMRERRELANLSVHDLKDIGYPAGAAVEQSKPFWEA